MRDKREQKWSLNLSQIKNLIAFSSLATHKETCTNNLINFFGKVELVHLNEFNSMSEPKSSSD